MGEAPTPRQQMGSCVRGSELWIFGGISAYNWENDVHTLDLESYVWTTITNITNVLEDGSGPAYLGGKGHTGDYRPATDSIIVFGGSPGVDTEPVNVNYVCEFNITSRVWRRWNTTAASSEDDIPPARNVGSSMIVNDVLYLFGGFSDLSQEDLTGVYQLDLVTRVWRLLPEITLNQSPSGRDSLTLIPLPPPAIDPLPADYRTRAVLFGGWGALVFSMCCMIHARVDWLSHCVVCGVLIR